MTRRGESKYDYPAEATSPAQRKAFRKKQRRLRKRAENPESSPDYVETREERLLRGRAGSYLEIFRNTLQDIWDHGDQILRQAFPVGTEFKELDHQSLIIRSHMGFKTYHRRKAALVPDTHGESKPKLMHLIVVGLDALEQVAKYGYTEYSSVAPVWYAQDLNPSRLREDTAIRAIAVHEAAHLLRAHITSWPVEEAHGKGYQLVLSALIDRHYTDIA